MSKDTKQLIADTFVALSRQKPIDKITVKDVVETCHVSRQTFYYHFQDLTAVMEWTLECRMQQVLEESLQADNLEDALRVFVATVAEHTKGILPGLLGSQRRAEIESLMLRSVRAYLRGMAENHLASLPVTYAEIQVSLDFYAYGITGLLLDYGVKGKIQVDQLTKQISCLIEGSMAQLA